MFSSVTNWLGVNIKGKEGATSEEDKENVAQPNKEQHSESRDSISSTSVETSTSSKSLPESESEENKSTSEEESNPDISALHALEDVSLKAFNTAKEFGNILFNFGKAAGKTVAETAKQLKTTVEEKTILGDFSKEQAKFVAEKNESKRLEDAVPPWVGYNEEEAMKSQILALSTDKRNFLRNPPSGVKFQFDFSNMYPIALATLQEDPNLQKMRFDLVPKKVPEETFWRNYFYRVSLIKQSMQLTTLAQQAEDSSSSSWSSSVSIEQKESPVPGAEAGKEEEVHESPANDEFVSDTFNGQHLCEEDVRREMEQLGVKDDKKEDEEAEWEKALQQELQDYEMVGGAAELEDPDLEREILQQIEEETQALS
ncbi:synapse-associated protein 1-like isoform X2 [Pomacea canaliculata]|uniref:synapse-associated protein 1-like isoform X2 n=1 Tax=Pomacea canaliculata TaxID=400727 RepID=UPI000D733872|nr:synapse-associated protein 1-like isoform X2 [Pomacea canaliculata]